MASKLPSMVVSAVSTWDGKALAKGGNQIAAFAKKAAGALGLAFSTQAVIKFGKDSVKAFAENEKSAKRLAGVVKNLGQDFETPFIEKNIDQISAKYGYQGEVIREAFQKVLTATGSVTKSNELLNASLDIAAGSGQDLVSVNQDLAALYQGNTKGLKKYNLGLSQAELKTLDFEDGLALLSKTFKGAAGDELGTYAGKMRVLGEAADNAQEIIGKSLVDSFALLSGEGNSVQPLADSMADLATYTGEVITGLATLINKFKELPGMDFYLKNIFPEMLRSNAIFGAIDALRKLAPDKAAPGMGRDSEHTGRIGYVDPNQAKRDKIERDRLKREKERRALDAKAAKDEKAKLSLSKAAAVFDSTRISLSAALKATYDKETKLRLEALMLIEQDKGDEALKKIGELAAFQKNADMQRLAGVETISNATLASLNTQLLTELKVINTSKMAEGDKELAREEAFKKYNAAITAAGTLAAKESYNERVQIQLTEIARLASLSKTYNAAKTNNLLLESSELSMIDRVAKAQADADAKRLKALNDYSSALGKVGTGLDYGGNKLGELIPNFVPPEWTKPGGPSTTMGPFAIAREELYTGNMGGGGGGGGSSTQTVEVTINTGIGDPEAIARALEDVLNQSTYRGTSVDRGTGNYAV